MVATCSGEQFFLGHKAEQAAWVAARLAEQILIDAAVVDELMLGRQEFVNFIEVERRQMHVGGQTRDQGAGFPRIQHRYKFGVGGYEHCGEAAGASDLVDQDIHFLPDGGRSTLRLIDDKDGATVFGEFGAEQPGDLPAGQVDRVGRGTAE